MSILINSNISKVNDDIQKMLGDLKVSLTKDAPALNMPTRMNPDDASAMAKNALSVKSAK